ncbi:MAG: heparinase II/III-family protein [Clostridiales bacterium]|nr:heparinase II/III-family protein [Clostridiales bacterium]
MFEEIRKQLPIILVKKSDFRYFPKYEDREVWSRLLPEQMEAYIRAGEQYLNYEWPVLPAKLYLDFTRNGNRTRYEEIYHRKRRKQLLTLFVAECCEGKGRFVDDIINGVWTILDEATWVIPAHMNENDNVAELPDTTNMENTFVDLFSAETASLLSIIYFVIKDRLDQVSPRICRRINYEIERRIFKPFLNRRDMWWMCYNRTRCSNWTTWIITNIIESAAIVCEDEDERLRLMDKCLEILEFYPKYNKSDGGCDEGPGYWNAAGAVLYDAAVLIDELTGDTSGLFDDELLHNFSKYICKVHIYSKYVVNFCDSGVRTKIDSLELYRMGKSFSDEVMKDEGIALDNEYYSEDKDKYYEINTIWFLPRFFKNMFAIADIRREKETKYPYLRDAWLEGIQWMTARQSGGTYKGLYLGAVAGHNYVNHNHNDVGSFIVYKDGKPAIIDLGTGVYERKTFSEQRYEIPQMQSQFHNLPTIDGIGQHNGPEFKATDVSYNMNDDLVEFKMNIAKAYEDRAGIADWYRTIRFDRRKKQITVEDQYNLNQKSDVMFSIMVAPKPVIDNHQVTLNVDDETKLVLKVDDSLDITYEEFPTAQDGSLRASWGECAYRILLKVKEKSDKGNYLLTIK